MASYVKNIFNAGEISPKVYARVDIDKWAGGCKTLLNTLPIPQGGLVRRPGFKHITTSKNNGVNVRLIPYIFSTTQAYILHFGPEYMRVYMNGGWVAELIDANTLLLLHCNGDHDSTDIIDEGATVHTVTAEGDAKLTTVDKKFGSASCTFDGTGDYCSVPDHADWALSTGNLTIDFWIRFDDIDVDQGFFSQRQDDSNRWYMYWSNATNKIIFIVRDTASNVIAITDAPFDPNVDIWYHIALIRGWGGAADDWAITVNGAAVKTFTDADGIPDITGTFNVGAAIIVGGGADIYLKGKIDEFRLSDVARWTANFSPPTTQYPAGDNSATPYELATTYNESDIADLQFTSSYDTIYITHQNFTPRRLLRYGHNNWNLADISFTDAPAEWDNNNGYPRACALYQDRLVFAGSTFFPSRLWLSKTGNHTVLTTGANDVDGMVLNLLSGTSDTILWLSSAKALVCGTDTGVHSIAAANGSDKALTPTNKRNFKESYYGTSEVFPVQLGDLIIHAGKPASSVRELAYSWQQDSYSSVDLTILADHLLEGHTIQEMAYQQSPHETVWCRRSDGSLLAMTYMQEQEVVAWSLHASGNVASIACIPGETETEFWIATHRNVNNATVTCIEQLSSFNETAFNSGLFLDSHKQHNGAETTTLSGLDHLEGQSNIAYFADGIIGTANVANNQITVANNSSVILAGLNYTSDIETLPIEVETQAGTSMFEEKRLTSIAIRSRNSAGATFGPDGNYQTQLFANNAFTDGIKTNLSLRGGFNPIRSVLIRQTDPLPLNIDAIGMEIETG